MDMSHLFSDSFLHVEITEEGLSLPGKEKEHPRVSRKEEGFFSSQPMASHPATGLNTTQVEHPPCRAFAVKGGR